MCKLDKMGEGLDPETTRSTTRQRTFLVSKTAAPEVNDLDGELVPEIQQNVLRLQITMNDVILPQDIQAVQQLPRIPEKEKF